MTLGWLGGARVLGKLSVLGRPTNLDNNRARAYCAYGRCGWGLFGHFFLSSIFSLFFLPLREAARYRLKYCLKGLLNPKQPTNIYTLSSSIHFSQLLYYLGNHEVDLLLSYQFAVGTKARSHICFQQAFLVHLS